MIYLHQGQEFQVKSGQTDSIKVYKYRDFLSKEVGSNISNSKIVVRKSVLNEIGGLLNKTSKTYPFDDYNLLLRIGTYGPCIVVEQPNTVVFRKHEANTTQKTKFMGSGLFSLIDAERKGLYPGGFARLFARYARLGGPACE